MTSRRLRRVLLAALAGLAGPASSAWSQPRGAAPPGTTPLPPPGTPADRAGVRPSPNALPRPRSLTGVLAVAGAERTPIVAMFSLPGCPFCEALRREQLGHLLRDASRRGVRVVELDVTDATPFEPPAGPPAGSSRASGASPASGASLASAESPAALARALDIRLVPTVVFLGPGGELAERLIGYASPDFYGAYLDDRIDTARARMR